MSELSTVNDFLDKLTGVKRCAKGWIAFCPGHDDRKHKSLSVTETNTGILINCHVGCAPESVVSSIGLSMADLFKDRWNGGASDNGSTPHNGNGKPRSEIEAGYPYRGLDGEIVSESIKFRQADGSKSYAQRHPWQASDDARLDAARAGVRDSAEGTRDKADAIYWANKLAKWKPTGWAWDLEGVERVPYRLRELVDADPGEPVFIPEGEKCVESVRDIGGISTTNPCGALKWILTPEFNSYFKDRDCIVLADDDPANKKTGLVPGLTHANIVCQALLDNGARRVRLVKPFSDNPPRKRDVDDWIQERAATVPVRTAVLQELIGLADAVDDWTMPAGGVEVRQPIEAPPATKPAPVASPTATGKQPDGATLADFYAYMVTHQYINVYTRELWPASSVDSQIRPIETGRKKTVKGKATDDEETIPAHVWLDQNKHVEQLVWSPGEKRIIKDRIVSDGGWIPQAGYAAFNLYRPGQPKPGDASQAGPWYDHVRKVYPDDADHIIKWLAHRVQHPEIKINHGLVLGGKQGTGKDTILEPVKYAIGPWNFCEVSPKHLTGDFNGFVKSVILRISEARDLGEFDRYSFYEHSKTYMASPPDVLRCNEKHLREQAVFNCSGVIITTNHKTDGIFLPADDRRHYVAWSELTQADFQTADGSDYFDGLWKWYEAGGLRHVAAYLSTLDLSGFNPKEPPKKTEAFWSIVDSGRSVEDSELSDILDTVGTLRANPADPANPFIDQPEAITIKSILDAARASADFDKFAEWLNDRKNKRQIPHRLETAGYTAVRNPSSPSDGQWKVSGRRCVVYAKSTLSEADRITAAGQLL